MTEDQVDNVARAVFDKANRSVQNRIAARNGGEQERRAVARAVAKLFTAEARS